jgi:hypothetical protein
MFTYLGKFLVLLNAFAAVAVLAWAAAVYFTRVDAADAVDTSGEKLTDKVKRLHDRAVKVQAGYAPEVNNVADADARLFALRGNIARRLDQSEKGVFYDIYGPRAAPDPTNPNAVTRVGNYVWTDDPARQVKALDGKPLGGVDQMRKNLIDEQTAASTHIDGIEKSVKALTVLNGEIDTLNARYAWLDERMKRHEAEAPVLADLRVNWENRGGSLQRRRNQLLLRLEDLKGAKVGAVPLAPVPTGPSAFTATPNNK